MLLMMNSISNIAARLQRLAIRMLDTTLSVVCGEVHANLDGAMQEINKIRILLHDKFYLGETALFIQRLRILLSIPGRYWKIPVGNSWNLNLPIICRHI